MADPPNIKGRLWSSLDDKGTACAHCGDAAAKKCGKCKNARYCSQECQLADWALHKSLCASWNEFKERPDLALRRAIMLEEDATKPRFAWMRVNVGPPENENDDYEDDSTSHPYGVPSDDPPTEMSVIAELYDLTNNATPDIADLVVGEKGRGELLDHSIYAVFRDTFLFDGSVPNRCVERCFDLVTQETRTMFRGPVAFYGMSKVACPSVTLDLDTNDLTLAVRGLLDCQNHGKGVVSQSFRKITGVKVAKSNDLDTDGLPVWKYENVKVPAKHPVFSKGEEIDSEACGGHVFMAHFYGKRSSGEVFKPKHVQDINPVVSLMSNSASGLRKHWTERDILIVAALEKYLDKDQVRYLCDAAIKKLRPVLSAALKSSMEDAETGSSAGKESGDVWPEVQEL